MRIEGSAFFAAPRDRVYAVFTDPAVLARATPGVQSLRQAGEDRYEAVMKMGVAGITGTYNGSLTLTAKRPPEHYELGISGQGAPGFVQGTGVFDFEAEGDGTRVRYVWDVQVGGLVAGVGQRVLSGVARMIIDQFMKAMEKAIAG